MNGEQINRLLKTINQFQGVFPSDKLPKNPPKGFYIVNLDPSTKPGSHWVAIHIISHKKAEYFDSYAYPPFVPNLVKFLERFSCTYNPMQLQNFQSDLCGEYCCFYVLHKSTGKTLKSLLKLFSAKTDINDCIMSRLYHAYFTFGRRNRRCHPNSKKCCIKYAPKRKFTS